MNEEIILKMVEPYVKDNSITYDQFENIFKILSKQEQYTVVEILYKKGVNLVDEQVNVDSFVLDLDENGQNDEPFEVLYDGSIFEDSIDFQNEILITNKTVKQSNEILCALIQQGNRQAAQDLCVKNKGLVDKYVLGYRKKYGNRLDFEDLEQAGYIGLLKAAQRFDYKLSIAFSTYAVFWIKQSISREIMDNGFAIRIPVHMMERINKVLAADIKLLINNGDMKLEERVSHISKTIGLCEDQVIECLVFRQNYLTYASLDAPVGEDEDSLLVDFIPDNEEVSVEEVVDMKMLKKELEEILSTLTERESKILKLRFGFDDGKQRTLEDIGNEFGVTRERIRQIEAKALRKLRHPSRSKKVKDYLK